MAKIEVPYSKELWEIEIPDKNLVGILESNAHTYKANKSQEDLVHEALDNYIGSNSLEELVHGKKNMVIITSDHTRPVPSKITLPIILKRIRKINPNIEVTILVSTGFHRSTTKEELINKMGKEIVENETIINHISTNDENMIYLGKLPSGGDLKINKLAVGTELLIAEGFIEPHFFAGFSGGRKSVLPGIASAKTIMANHCSEFIASPYARTGILENNPIHTDMLYAAEQAKLAFILNVVIDSDKNIIKAFAGDSKLAHEAGCKFVSELAGVDNIKADIVVTTNGGYPLDQNVYQSVKGMTAAEACCKKDGVIIMISACNDGHGGKSFYDNLANTSSPKEVLEKVLKIPRNETMPDQWEFQILARILDNFKVILVTDLMDPQMVKNMHMEHAYTFNEALEKAFKLRGNDATITVIPDGVSVIVH